MSFFVEARNDQGLEATYPLVAPAGSLSFDVRTDSVAPKLERFQPARSTVSGAGTPEIRVLCKDDMHEPEVILEYAVNGTPQTPVTLAREAGTYWYSGAPSVALNTGDLMSYRVKGRDNAAAPNEDLLPKLGQVFCPVAAHGEGGGGGRALPPVLHHALRGGYA